MVKIVTHLVTPLHRVTIPAIWLAGVLAVGGCRSESPLHGAVLEPPGVAADFTLTDHHGREFTLSDHEGRFVLLFFGFTSCPDVCPTTLGTIKSAMLPLGDHADRVVVAMVTVDGERDTSEQLATYLGAFDPNFLGLTGTADELATVYKAYGIEVIRRDTPDSVLEYTIDHTAALSVIDDEGRMREIFYYGTPVEHIAEDLQYLLGLS